ncbi:hypothetical protein N3K66_005228 [Trichothecium roseum]|uniref:Uncharacterized protein n=1 Tax=Trichothecium roseum TaxID=47278 RepID=A0ACC0V655_9HYPO|nr:hypothetical protein N3K66_005228 [Trichothecium roseum]
MPGQYIITEPSPSTTSYLRSGRGGAGNITRPPTTTTSSTPSSSTTAPASSSRSLRFFSGVGGAGNAHKADERPVLSLDDEVRRLAAQQDAAVGHCGIGGAGNVYRRKASDAGSSSSSSSGSSGGINDDAKSDVSEASSLGRAKMWARGAFRRD